MLFPLALFLTALLVGFVWYARQSLVVAEAIRRGRSRGFRAALRVQVGSLAGDAMWLAGALVVLALAVQLEPVGVIFSVAGSFLFLRFAWSALMDGRQELVPRIDLPVTGDSFEAGANLSLRNPFALGIWLAISAATILLLAPIPQPADYLVFWSGTVIGALTWCALLASFASHPGAPPSHAFFRTVNIFCAVVLTSLGVIVLWSMLHPA